MRSAAWSSRRRWRNTTRIASVDHAPTQVPATADLYELGGVDLTDAAQARKAIDAAASHFGKIDALINIAGGFPFETLEDGDRKPGNGCTRSTSDRAERLARGDPASGRLGAGRIVNIGAMGALQAGSGMGPYAASKAGVHRLTEALAAELKGKITVNAVLPRPSTPPPTAPTCPRPTLEGG